MWRVSCLSDSVLSVRLCRVCPTLSCLSDSVVSVRLCRVCPTLSCLSNSVVSVRLCCVCPTLLCLSDSVVSVRLCCVCPTLLCLSDSVEFRKTSAITNMPTHMRYDSGGERVVCLTPSELCKPRHSTGTYAEFAGRTFACVFLCIYVCILHVCVCFDVSM